MIGAKTRFSHSIVFGMNLIRPRNFYTFGNETDNHKYAVDRFSTLS